MLLTTDTNIWVICKKSIVKKKSQKVKSLLEGMSVNAVKQFFCTKKWMIKMCVFRFVD